MEQRFIKPLVIFFFISFQKIKAKKYIGLYRGDYLKTLVAPKHKKLKNIYKVFKK